jgi:hypothetical protein
LAAGFLIVGFDFVAVAFALTAGALVVEDLIAFPLVVFFDAASLGAAAFLTAVAEVFAGFEAM